MSKRWQPIESAPKDGRKVWVKRVYEGRIVKEGWAVWGSLASEAPQRQWSDGGLDGPIPPDHESADAVRWCNEDKLHRFPEPTHWLPDVQPSETPKEDISEEQGK